MAYLNKIFIIACGFFLVNCSGEMVFMIKYPYLNKHEHIPKLVHSNHLITDSSLVRKIAVNLNEYDKIQQYGNWFRYYSVPHKNEKKYLLILRQDDASDSEYMFFLDEMGNVTTSYKVAESYADGADFKRIYSIYKRRKITQYTITGQYLIDKASDTIIDTLPPVSDTLIRVFRLP